MPVHQYPEKASLVNLAARKRLEGSGEAQGWAYASVPAWLSYRSGGAVVAASHRRNGWWMPFVGTQDCPR